jgi:hypothetical protein
MPTKPMRRPQERRPGSGLQDDPAIAHWYITGELGEADPHAVVALRRLFRRTPVAGREWARALGLPLRGRRG